MKKLFYFFCLCGVMLLNACSKSSVFSPPIEYLPFQEEKGGYWGMISPDGKVLFSGEFKEEPTVAMNGRFFVKNGDGLWKLYTAEEKPKKLGEEYLEVVSFREDVTPVVRKNQSIELINLDGETVCTLDKVEGKRVLDVYEFSEGIAVFRTSAGYGCINKSGEVVIEPKYADIKTCSEGKLIAVDNKYKDAGKSERKYCVLDKSGNVTSEFSVKNMEDMAPVFKEGLLPVEIEDEGSKTKGGLMNEKGEWVVKPSSKTRGIGFVYNGHFVFNDGDGCGLKNIDGETVIRAKYKSLSFASDEMLIYENEKGEQGLLDLQGNKLFDDTYSRVYGLFAEKYLLVKEGMDDWAFIDTEGNTMSKKTDIYNVGLSFGGVKVSSDYFSYEALFEEAGITKDGFGKYKYGMKAAEIAGCGASSTDAGVKPERYTGMKSDSYGENILKCSVTVGAVFTDNMASYDSNGNCRFSESAPKVLSVIIPATGKLSEKSDEIYDAAKAYVAKLGKLVKDEAGNAVYDLGGGRQIVVVNNSSAVALLMTDNATAGALAKTEDKAGEAPVEEDEAFQPDNSQPEAAAAGSNGALSNLLSTRKLTYNDIRSLSKPQLRILRNEIYARHGYIFKSADLKAYFSKYPWYKPLYGDVTSKMSGIEKYNAAFIKKYE